MTMKPVFIFAIIFASTAAITPSYGETFQWKDSNGQTVVSDTPPPATAKGRRSIGCAKPNIVADAAAESSAEAPKVSEAPKSMAEKDLEFKKRQQEAKEKAEKQAKEQFKKYRGDGAGLFIPADIPADSLEALRVQKVSI